MSGAALSIALAAGLGLFAELSLIRLHSSYFQLFAYFKNLSLLSAFMGLGIGYARGRTAAVGRILPLFALQVLALYALRFSPVEGLLQNPVPEQLTMGLGDAAGSSSTVFVWFFVAAVFAFNAYCFIPLGELAAERMRLLPPLAAYQWNLLGSLAGIAVFNALCFLWLPPAAWFAVSALGVLYFLWKAGNAKNLLAGALCALAVILCLSAPARTGTYDIYSPYQLLTLHFRSPALPDGQYQEGTGRAMAVETSHTFYQSMLDLSEENIKRQPQLAPWERYYGLPYRFKPEPARVLIVGSGTGNDVAAALRSGAGRVDAVEIDPAILSLGRSLHPESPYSSPRVRTFVDDARAFLNRGGERYDLIVYGLLDSHTLLSGNSSSIRLDSFVYTVEGLRRARQRLTENGVVCLTFGFMSPQIVQKLYQMMEEAFDGQKPVVYRSGPLMRTLVAGPGVSRLPASLSERDVLEAYAAKSVRADASTDDWPFIYMPVRRYPLTYLGAMLLMGVVTLLFLRRFAAAASGFSTPAFFLGAGFMLIETKAVTELALLFGSTWLVTGTVIAVVLVMAFLSNALVIRKGGLPTGAVTTAIVASLFAGYAVTYADRSALTAAWFWLPALLMLPVFFSGMAFSAVLDKEGVSRAIYSNLLGAMLGGFLEYQSMYFGFRALYLVAALMYVLALVSARRRG